MISAALEKPRLIAQQLVGLGDVELSEALEAAREAEIDFFDKRQLRSWSDAGIASGNPVGPLALAKALAAGLVGAPDPKGAIEVLRSMMTARHLPSQFTLAVLLFEDSRTEAMLLLNDVASKGHPSALRALAFEQLDDSETHDGALVLMQKAAERLDPMALHWQAMADLAQVGQTSIERGLRSLKLAADKNLAGACADLGAILLEGRHGVKRDSELGEYYLKKAKELSPLSSE